MDVVLLSLFAALCFGAMTVALRRPTVTGSDPLAGAFATVVPAIVVVAAVAAVRGQTSADGIAPFLLAGLIAPGISQVLFTYAVRDAGPSRTSAAVGLAPLVAVTLAVVLLDETVPVGVGLGAIAIVAGGVSLASERGRPEHVRRIGLVCAVAAMAAFAARDTFVRWLATDGAASPQVGASATLLAGAAVIAAVALVSRRPVWPAGSRAFVPAGLLFGVSYACLFEALYRGKLSLVAPLIATEALWGVALSALILRRHEAVGRHLAVGVVLIVLGGALIGIYRT